MDDQDMTNEIFQSFLRSLLHILENEDKGKAIELIRSLIKN